MNFSPSDLTAQALLHEHGLAGKRPVPIDELAAAMDVRVVRKDLGSEVSGLLSVNDDESHTIYVHAHHPKARQRFTIAHEIAHKVLGHLTPTDRVHVDRVIARTTGARRNVRERAADELAAALLMPAESVRERHETLAWVPIRELAAEILAEEFRVSVEAMKIRLTELRLWSD